MMMIIIIMIIIVIITIITTTIIISKGASLYLNSLKYDFEAIEYAFR